MRVVCVLFSENQNLQKIAEIFCRITPQVTIREGEAIFLEIEQCRRLFDESTIVLRIKSLLNRLKVGAQVAVADDPPTALAFARTGVKDKMNLPVEALENYSSPFSKDPVVLKECQKIIWALHRLGVLYLSEFVKLPIKTLTSRFGALGLTLHRRVHVGDLSPWPKFKPTSKVIERMDWGHELSCDTMDSIFFYIKTLLDRTLLRLFGRGERLVAFQITFEMEKHSLMKSSSRVWRFDLNLPHGSSKNVLPLIREKVSFDLARVPLESLVNAMELKVLEVAPSFLSQRDIFHPKKEEEQEAWNNLITRLSQKLGKSHIFCARPVESYVPERNWVPELKETMPPSVKPLIPFPRRPMRLLKNPRPIDFNGELICIDQTPKKVVNLWGPEVLSGEWWDEKTERIYYRVLSETGEQFWVFQSSYQFYLHGIYD